METDINNQHSWCKFDAIDPISFRIAFSALAVQSVMLVVFCQSVVIRRRIGQPSKPEKFVKRMIRLWFLVAIVKSIINIIVFETIMNHNLQQAPYRQRLLSSICLFCDRMSSFTLHTILLKIPCIWIYNTVMKLDTNELTQTERIRADKALRILTALGIYFKIRLLIVLVNLSFVILMMIKPTIGRYSNLLTLITLFEATLCILTYTFGIFTMLNFRKRLQICGQVYKRLGIEYFLLLLCCLARLSFNVMLYFTSINTYQQNPDCSHLNPETDEASVKRYLYMTLGYFLMHVLPILTILIVYWPDKASSPDSSAQIFFNENSSPKSATSTRYSLIDS